MDIFKICAVAIISVILILHLKSYMPHMQAMISIVCGIIIFMIIMPTLREVLNIFLNIIRMLDISVTHIGIILKIIGISYICEFCTSICLDAGEGAIASKIEIAGKILIMFISMPILIDLLNLISGLLP